MTVQVSYPGVYIDEFAPGAPIEGVGTSTVAFLGPCKDGPLNEPTKVTSFEQFKTTFGDSPVAGYYLWYAVRGFFENGGMVCYVTRVSNAAPDVLVLNDVATVSAAAKASTIRLFSRQPGNNTSDPIQALVDQNIHSTTSNTKLYRPTALLKDARGSEVTVDTTENAQQFRSGDLITWNGINETDDVVVMRVEGAKIRLTQPLTNIYAPGTGATITVRLADLTAGTTTVVRMMDGSMLSGGSVISLSQNVPAIGGQAAQTIVDQFLTVKNVDVEKINPSLSTYRVILRTPVGHSFNLSAADVGVQSFEFSITIKKAGPAYQRLYTPLSMDPENAFYYAKVINNDPVGLIYAAPIDPPNLSVAPNNRPCAILLTSLTGGSNDNPATLTSSDYKQALSQLEAIDDVNIVSIPDRSADPDVQLAMIAHCERMMDRFAILDSKKGAPLFGTDSVDVQRQGLDSTKGYAALYYPWLLVSPASGDKPLIVPPSGHIAGIFARTDDKRGVFKAPAGTEASVNGVLGIERNMSDIDQGQLNMHGVNVIRVFQSGGRPTVWGARTTATDTNWQYVNIRRLFLFLEESIQEGIRWAIFEPNNLSLWQKLKRTLRAFLVQQWRDGALFGAKEEEAFYVRIDEAINTPTSLALGRLNIEIGLRPTYPAEFIVVKIGIWQGGSDVSET